MEHMYVHSVVVRMCWVAGCHIWIKCKLCIQDLELSCTQQPSCCQGFTVAKVFFLNPKLGKERKIFYTRFKQAIRLRFTGISSR